MHTYIRNVDAKKLTHTTCGVVSNMIVQRTLEHLEWKLLGGHLYICKSYAFLLNYKDVAQYLGLPHPFQF